MSRTIANAGGLESGIVSPFARILQISEPRGESLKEQAHRIGTVEQNIRRWRQTSQSPDWNKAIKLRFNDEERFAALCQLTAARFRIVPLNPDEVDRRRQFSLIGISTQELRGFFVELAGAAQELLEISHEVLADNRVDADEQQTIQMARLKSIEILNRIDPEFWRKVR